MLLVISYFYKINSDFNLMIPLESLRTDLRGSGSLWCFFSGQYKKACRTFWCSRAYISIGIVGSQYHASSTPGLAFLWLGLSGICSPFFQLFSSLPGWERYWWEKIDLLSWGWTISGTWNQLLWNFCILWNTWRGWFHLVRWSFTSLVYIYRSWYLHFMLV